jgi:predicted dienelactone hydrolase
MSVAPTRELLVSNGFDADAAAAPLTAGHEGAPVLRTPGRLPVIVFSHGAGGHRSETTIVVQELASHGYVVVTVDHTYDAFSEFPGVRRSSTCTYATEDTCSTARTRPSRRYGSSPDALRA